MKNKSKCYNNKLNKLRPLIKTKLKKKEKKHSKEKRRILKLLWRNNKLRLIWKSRKKDNRGSLRMKRQERPEKNCIRGENRWIKRSRRPRSKSIRDIWRRPIKRPKTIRIETKMRLIMRRDKRSWTNSLLHILFLMSFRWHNRVYLRLWLKQLLLSHNQQLLKLLRRDEQIYLRNYFTQNL